ncbi:MAG: SLBB domain-containing protein [Bacteroidota bacterium]
MKKIFFLLMILSVSSLFAQEDEKKSNQLSNILLSQPITVTIGGEFIVTGSFTAFKTQRLDHFITSLYAEAESRLLSGKNDKQLIKQITKEIKKYALRNITLKHINGEERKIDLLKFRLTGDFNHNPFLQNDDVVIFPAYNDEKNVVTIDGAVNKAGKYQFVNGDKLSDVILFAGGLNTAYDNITTAEISRLNNSGDKEEIILADINKDIELKSGDRIKILADENHKRDYKVLVLGEVKFPGFIYVTADGMNLADVISRTGGFKTNADLSRAEVVRNFNSIEMLQKYKLTQEYLDNTDLLLTPETQLYLKQQKQLLEMSRLYNLLEEDTLFYNIDNQLRILKAESLADFTQLNNPESEDSKFVVKDGDLILVPEKFDYVYVFGQVPKAGYIKYTPEKNYKYYIEQAGGLAETAREDEEEIVVIKGKEMNWVTKEKEKLNLEPGDYIYVPKEIPRNFWYHFSKFGGVMGVIGSAATILLLILQLNPNNR